MAAYEPPTATYPIFDSLVFQSPNEASLTMAEGDLRYLARQNVATSVASSTTFSGDVSVGSSILDYTTGTGLTIRTTANSESMIMNVLDGSGNTKQKIELNTNHLHLYDNVRLTDSSAPSNFTLFQQSGATCNIDNGNVNSTTINLKTRTSGGGSVTPLSITSTAISVSGNVRYYDRNNPTKYSTLTQADIAFSFQNTSVNNGTVNFEVNTSGGVPVEPLILTSTQALMGVPILLDYTTAPTSGQLGFVAKNSGTASDTAMTSGTVYNLITAGNSIVAGTYSVSIYFRATHTAVAGSIQTLKIGVSISNTGFSGGFNDVVTGSSSIPATAGEIVGQLTQTLYVSATTTFYLLAQMSFTTIVPSTRPSTCYAQWTRIA